VPGLKTQVIRLMDRPPSTLTAPPTHWLTGFLTFFLDSLIRVHLRPSAVSSKLFSRSFTPESLGFSRVFRLNQNRFNYGFPPLCPPLRYMHKTCAQSRRSKTEGRASRAGTTARAERRALPIAARCNARIAAESVRIGHGHGQERHGWRSEFSQTPSCLMDAPS
jgi:hypothetical protein